VQHGDLHLLREIKLLPFLRIQYNMSNSKKTYAYADGSLGWQHPSNRRRFPKYCQLAHITLEKVDWGNLPDVLVVNQAADLTYCSKLNQSGCKIIFDANDGYLIPKKGELYDPLRGLVKFILRQHKYPEMNYEGTYLRMCERADAVVCSHPLQAGFLKKYCDNIHLITDFGPSINLNLKQDYEIKDSINIFWEGLGSAKYMPFEEMDRIFGTFKNKSLFKFHFFTDLEFKKVSNRLFSTTVMDECRKKAPQIASQCYFYQWNETMFSSVATKCDLAIIPIPLDNTFAMYKPENKLVLMWRMGIPTVVSATPSYLGAMSKAGLNLACTTDAEWQEKIKELLESEALRRVAGEKGFRQVTIDYSDKVLCSKWNNVLSSLS
jgi:hypothetical protein